MGNAWIAVSQAGDADNRLSATEYTRSFGSGFSARSTTSFARSWVSVSGKRTRTPYWSSTRPLNGTFDFLSASSTRATSAGSTLTVDFAVDTWTAGASPKKFGSVYRKAAATTNPMSAYFQVGKRFTWRPASYWRVFKVPFGSGTCTAARCTTTSVFGAISTVTY